MDESLSWKYQVQTIKSKLSRSIFVLNRVKHLFPHDILRTLYFSLIHSHLVYGITAWGSSTFISQLDSLQKRALRIINNKPYNSHTAPLFKQGNILRVNDLYRLQILMFAHDFKHDKLPRSFTSYFPSNAQYYSTTRHTHHLYRHIPRTKFSTNLPVHIIPSTWNALSNNITSIDNINSFKSRVKKDFLNNYVLPVLPCNNPRCPDCRPII